MTEATGTSSQVTASFTEAAQALFTAGNPADTLNAVVALAVAAIDGCDFASIYVGDANFATRAVGSDPEAAEVDAAQHRIGKGPAIDALDQGGPLYAEDLTDEQRWGDFGTVAVTAGVRSAIAIRVSDDSDRLAALCLYARYPRAFGALDRAKAVILAAMAGLALSAAVANEDQSSRAIQAALDTREMIGQAQGILMEREGISADQAYEILRQAAEHLETRIRDVARTLVSTGESPQTGST